MADNNGRAGRVSDFLDLKPFDLIGKLEPYKVARVPTGDYMTAEDANAAAKELMRLAANYSFLSSLLSYAKVAKREMQRSGDKTAYQDAIDREDIIERALKSVDTSYRAINRATTIWAEVQKEISMTGGMT